MKKLLVALILFASLAQAQIQSGAKEIVTTDTLSSVVSAYADGQMVRGGTANKIILATAIPDWLNKNNAGFNTLIKLELDSVCVGLFDLYALKDSAGTGASLTANHGTFQLTKEMSNNTIYKFSINTETAGTYAGGARTSMGFAKSFVQYNLASTSMYKKIYWVLVARGAYTPKQSGIVRLTVQMDQS